MADDYRQRVAEAIAAKFTYPAHRCDRDGENERVENAEPADRIDQTPYVMVTAGDGCRSFYTPTCAELANVVADVRDQDVETLRSDNEDLRKLADSAEAVVARVREIHHPVPCENTRHDGGNGQHCAVCEYDDVSGNIWPCPTIRALDGNDRPGAVTVRWDDLDLVMNGAGRPESWETYVDACQRIRDALEGGRRG